MEKKIRLVAFDLDGTTPVSYTHLDVYKRQELDRTETTDGVNGRFRFLVNGVEILCKGSNWVPLDAFHSLSLIHICSMMRAAGSSSWWILLPSVMRLASSLKKRPSSRCV